MDSIREILELLKCLERDVFTGFIRINYNRGSITRVEKNDELYGKKNKIVKR